MSWPALTWAKALVVGSSTEKAVLLALAYRHNEDLNKAFPSIASICEFTELNRKTVIGALAKLEGKGLISDSGERVGLTKQVIAYSLSIDAENEQFQKRDTLKKHPKSPNFSPKQSQKRDTERDGKTTSESKDSSESPADDSELPLGLPPLPPKEVTPLDLAAFITSEWVTRAHATALRGGRPSEANIEKAMKLALDAAVEGQTPIDVWREIFEKIDGSGFLQGKVPGREGRPPFKLTLSFLLEKRNFVKTLEGRFDGHSTGEQRRGSTSQATGNFLNRIRSGQGRGSGGRGTGRSLARR